MEVLRAAAMPPQDVDGWADGYDDGAAQLQSPA
jgi:hypothetical protein